MAYKREDTRCWVIGYGAKGDGICGVSRIKSPVLHEALSFQGKKLDFYR